MSKKYKCGICGVKHKSSSLYYDKMDNKYICYKCKSHKSYYNRIGGMLPLTSFEGEMEKVHEISDYRCCYFSPFLWEQSLMIRGVVYIIKRQVYFPKDLIGLKFKLNDERLEVTELNGDELSLSN